MAATFFPGTRKMASENVFKCRKLKFKLNKMNTKAFVQKDEY